MKESNRKRFLLAIAVLIIGGAAQFFAAGGFSKYGTICFALAVVIFIVFKILDKKGK